MAHTGICSGGPQHGNLLSHWEDRYPGYNGEYKFNGEGWTWHAGHAAKPVSKPMATKPEVRKVMAGRKKKAR